MPHKIVGISGSPVKNGNVDSFLGAIMDLASEKGLNTETINLSRMNIRRFWSEICLKSSS